MGIAFGFRGADGKPQTKRAESVTRSAAPFEAPAPPPTVAAPPAVMPAPLEEVIRQGRVSPAFANLARARPDMFKPALTTGASFAEERPLLLHYPRVAQDIYLLVRHSPMLAAAILAVRNGSMRKPAEVVPAFGAKCDTCGWTSEQAVKVCGNEECGNETRRPDPEQKKRLELLLKKPSVSGVSFAELCEMLEDDINTLDDAILVMEFDYPTAAGARRAVPVGDAPALVDPVLIGIERANPSTIAMVSDARGNWFNQDENGVAQGYFTCRVHRKENVELDPRAKCKTCGAEMLPVRYVAVERNRLAIGYFDHEVVHWSKFFPSETWGFSPVIVLWTLTRASIGFDLMLAREAEQNRPPKGILVFVSSNTASLKTEILTELEESRNDPLYIPAIAMESMHEKGGVQWVPFTLTPIELDLVNTRKEMRQQILAMYQLEPIQVADTASSGGLNNESQQLEARDTAIERDHNIWHHRVFPKIVEAAKATDWKIAFPSPFERDAAQRAGIRGLNLELMTKVVAGGGEIDRDSIDEETWEFRWTGDLEPPASPFDEPGKRPGDPQDDEDPAPDDQDAKDKNRDELARAVDSGPIRGADLLDAFMAEWTKMERQLARELKIPRDPGPMREVAARVIQQLVGNLAGVARTQYADLLLRGFRGAGVPVAQAGLIEGALRAVQQDSTLWKAFDGLGEALSARINGVVVDAFTKPLGFDIAEIVRGMRDVVDLETYRLTRIARSEAQHVVAVGREFGYRDRDPENEYRYRWAGPLDARTSEHCRWIVSQIPKTGLPLDALKALVREAALKFNGPGWVVRDWSSHPNCRFSPRRVVA